MRIARRPVMTVFPGEVVGVLAHVESAHEHGIGRLQALDERCIPFCARSVVVYLRSGAGRPAGDIDQILYGKRNARQGTESFAVRASPVDSLRAGKSPLAQYIGESVHRRVQLRDVLET